MIALKLLRKLIKYRILNVQILKESLLLQQMQVILTISSQGENGNVLPIAYTS